MRMRFTRTVLLCVVAALTELPAAQAGSLTYSHSTSALPAAPGPAITLLSITGTNDGTNYNLTLAFANPTIEGPSSISDDAVYGFINLDTDHDAATGVKGTTLDTTGFEPGFGQYSPDSLGIDAIINLSSEGDPFHGGPGLVDLVAADGFTPITTVPITYTSEVGATPSMLTISIPLTDFSDKGISLLDTGDFSVAVGNEGHATDFLPSAAGVPEPGSALLLALGASLTALAVARVKGPFGPTRHDQAIDCPPRHGAPRSLDS